jgi:uncharacterized protein
MAEPILVGQHGTDIQCLLQTDKANRHGLITGATGTGKTVIVAFPFSWPISKVT